MKRTTKKTPAKRGRPTKVAQRRTAPSPKVERKSQQLRHLKLTRDQFELMRELFTNKPRGLPTKKGLRPEKRSPVEIMAALEPGQSVITSEFSALSISSARKHIKDAEFEVRKGQFVLAGSGLATIPGIVITRNS